MVALFIMLSASRIIGGKAIRSLARKACLLTIGSGKGILNASLEIGSLSLERFSRWLRAICSIVLVRNVPEDRAKALGYFEQAISVIEEYDNNAKEVYIQSVA